MYWRSSLGIQRSQVGAPHTINSTKILRFDELLPMPIARYGKFARQRVIVPWSINVTKCSGDGSINY